MLGDVGVKREGQLVGDQIEPESRAVFCESR